MTESLTRMEAMLSGLLRYGALAACACIAVGMASSSRLVALGVVMIILLPVLRVTLMAGIFLKEKDYRFAAISAVVLGIIVSGFIWGLTHLGGRGLEP